MGMGDEVSCFFCSGENKYSIWVFAFAPDGGMGFVFGIWYRLAFSEEMCRDTELDDSILPAKRKKVLRKCFGRI